MRKIFLLIIFECIFALIGANAYADGCDALDSNPDWSVGIVQLHGSLRHENYAKALSITRELSKICARSPSLNYTIGKIYQKIGNNTRALEYMQKATEYSSDFVVSQESLEQMWYARYEAEHQDTKSNNRLEIAQQKLDRIQDNYFTALITSISIMSVGAILTCVGIGLVANNDEPMSFNRDQKKASVSSKTYLYTGLMAGGIGVTLTGTVLTGVMGYHYMRSKKEDYISLSLSPLGAGLFFRF